MKAKFVNEKLTNFTEDSDPIEDMGIGGIKPRDVYNEILAPAEKRWEDFVNNLVGKQVTGKFAYFDTDVTSGESGLWVIFVNPATQKKITVEIKAISREESENRAEIIFIDESNESLVMYANEKYSIKG